MANTISTHNGNSSKVRRNHNIRNPKYVEKERHIDPNKPHEKGLTGRSGTTMPK